MFKRLFTIMTLTSVTLGLAVAANGSDQLPKFDLSMKHEIGRSIAQGLSFLAKSQKPDGSWSDYPGVTGLVLTAFLRAPIATRDQYAVHINAGLKYIIGMMKNDGGIYPDIEPQMKAYNTSVCLMALVAADNPALSEPILKARRFLISLQADEKSGVPIDSASYGGIGYNKDERSDVSNMQFALEALRASDKYEPAPDNAEIKLDDSTGGEVKPGPNDLYWGKAITFLQRCQNYKKYNDYSWSSNDGGFVYYPGNSKAGNTTSYGSMTYAGVKSFIHAGLTRDDDRVQAAVRWIRSNYTVDRNPELDKQGLYYYYHVMAKALAVVGDSILTDTTGTAHDWRGELANRLIAIQLANGSWVNDNGRWWENNPDLVTAYCLMALEEIAG